MIKYQPIKENNNGDTDTIQDGLSYYFKNQQNQLYEFINDATVTFLQNKCKALEKIIEALCTI